MTHSPLIGAIDQGTTSTRFVLFDVHGKIVTYHQVEFKQHYPHPGWVEHDPLDLLSTVNTCIEQALLKLRLTDYEPKDIQCIGITNQRETTLVWDSETGQPLYRAIVWSDNRTAHTVQALVESHSEQEIHDLQRICGLPVTSYFSAVKLKWMLEHVPAVKDAYEEGRLHFGTVDTWLIYNLTGGAQDNGVMVTDVTNASRTMLMDLHTLTWSKEGLRFFGFEKLKLAKIAPSSHIYGFLSHGSLAGVPISGCLGDQQSALVGQKCFSPGDAKCTYGTGCFLLFNTGRGPPTFSHHGLLTTVAYQLHAQAPPVYALEGSVAVAGSSLQWLRDTLALFKESSDINALASQVTSTAGVYFVTALSGLLAPYWRSDARGMLIGLTQYTRKEHIARATLEAVCYQTRAILEAMSHDATSSPQGPQDDPSQRSASAASTSVSSLKVDGGLSNSDVCMQIQADILGHAMTVERPHMRETTALGAAMAAGLAVGIWKSIDELKNVNQDGNTIFQSNISAKKRDKMYNGWKEAVKRSYGWADIVDNISEDEEEEETLKRHT
ncbi:hypothetical protein BDF20DRAFT_917339 [Mycotypha africana]|uniref:uncharacterized protein n=1 Tax=Mycotypha africana TaxID=64632 RepID=UPI00230163BD|nr:uncharacterized protein BDF20DRAFT_917339 [Mycotypha africana]KAI8967737.1 hypothetical protein BDF20DRAFT_917339 [Mycotypha africana]